MNLLTTQAAQRQASQTQTHAAHVPRVAQPAHVGHAVQPAQPTYIDDLAAHVEQLALAESLGSPPGGGCFCPVLSWSSSCEALCKDVW